MEENMEQANMKESEELINLARRIDKLLSVDPSLIDQATLDGFNFLVQSGVVNTMSGEERKEFSFYWNSIKEHVELRRRRF